MIPTLSCRKVNVLIMKRVIAFLIDTILLNILIVGTIFVVLFDNIKLPIEYFYIMILLGLILWLGYFIIADCFFQGMTLGKKILGIQMLWSRDGFTFRNILKHVFSKWVLSILWPVGLSIYLINACRMPYDRQLGIYYPSKQEDKAGKVSSRKHTAYIIVIIAMFVVIFVGIMLTLRLHISTEDYYILKTEKVASVYTILGEQQLVSYSARITSDSVDRYYKYNVDGKHEELIKKYTEYLIQNEGFQRTSESFTVYDSGAIILDKISSDKNYSITIILESLSNYLKVTLHCEPISK